MHSPLLNELHDPHVRALAWLLGSPQVADARDARFAGKLVPDSDCATYVGESAAWLRAQDAAPNALHAFINARADKVLGHYAETLMQFWLSSHDRFRLLVSNRPIYRTLPDGTKRSLGELDFLLQDSPDHRVLHWELAVKFYLQAEGGGMDGYVGVDTQDRLSHKIDKLFTRQLALSNTPEARGIIPSGIDFSAMGWFKGVLFYPIAEYGLQTPVVPGLSLRHLRGWWLRFERGLNGVDRLDPTHRYIPLKRQQWLHPVHRSLDESALSLSGLRKTVGDLIAVEKRGVMVAAVKEVDGSWAEQSRGFVLPADWKVLPPRT
jgi:uncharacterized protein